MKTPHLKNWIAFKILMDACIEDSGKTPDREYFIEKFTLYVLSDKPDEYKWGLHAYVTHRLYKYFDHYNIPLDEDEQKAKDEMKEWEECDPAYDRRWGKNKK